MRSSVCQKKYGIQETIINGDDLSLRHKKRPVAF